MKNVMMLALAATALAASGTAAAAGTDKPATKVAAADGWRTANASAIAGHEATLAAAKERFEMVIDNENSTSLQIERAEVRYNEARADYYYHMDKLRLDHERAGRATAMAAAAAR